MTNEEATSYVEDSALAEKVASLEEPATVETIVSEDTSNLAGEPALLEEFDMDKLIDDLLNPVIDFETTNNSSKENTILNEVGSSKELFTEEANNEKESNVSLVPSSEKTYLVSPRKLRKFYLFSKKIKLAFYKAFVSIPKLLFGAFNKDNG